MRHSMWPWLNPVIIQQYQSSREKTTVWSSQIWKVSSSPATACWTLTPSTSPATWTAATTTVRPRCAAPWQPTLRPAALSAHLPPSGSPRRTAVRGRCHLQDKIEKCRKWKAVQFNSTFYMHLENKCIIFAQKKKKSYITSYIYEHFFYYYLLD